MVPTMADSGAAAITAMTQARDAGEPFALILLDVLMPGMDGFEVAEWIQRNSELAGTAVMLLSSADLRSDTERCAALGISVFLRKPVKASELFDAVLKVVGIATTPAAESYSTDGPREPARRLQVLLAEDTPVNQRLAVALLEERGHTVIVANDGREAVDLLLTHRVDLILMDVQMPRMDGFQATAAIRALEAGTAQRIPIIAMTAHAMKGDCERCLAAGMDGYISKPIRAERFLSVVEGWTVSPTGREAIAEPEEPSQPTEAVFDPERALARSMGKRPLLAKLSQLFLGYYPDLLTEINAALLAGDAGTLERASHSLKSSAGSLCADRVFEAALRLEEIGRGGDLADAEPACARLRRELFLFDQALKAWEKGMKDEDPDCRR
jgi:CheY-like chemotaxis protein